MAQFNAAAHRQALTELLGAPHVRWDDSELSDHAHDYWVISALRELQGRLENRPLCVVRPPTLEHVVAVLRYANEQRLPVVPFGAGSGACGGVQPTERMIVIDMRRMDRILELSETACTVRVQAGKMGGVFEAELNAAGYSMRHFPQSIDVSTVGGWVATRAAGQYSTRYGNIEDALLALQVVLPTGDVVQTRVGPRSSTGPDVRNMFIGAEGTLGIVTELTARIVPLPESSVTQAITFASFDAGLDAIRDFMRVGWRPPVVRLYDGTESARLFASWCTDKDNLLLLLSEGPQALTAVEMAECTRLSALHGGRVIGAGPVEHWHRERNNVPGWQVFLKKGLVLDTIEVATTWDKIHQLYREVVAALQSVEGILVASGHSSHSYATGTNIYFTFVAATPSPEKAEGTYFACWAKAMEATLKCGATIGHHHGVGRLRTPWMARELDGGLDVLRKLKRALDPNGIMNPGVLIPD
jgi:alkyldihydroxyacetonephosphate synthase